MNGTLSILRLLALPIAGVAILTLGMCCLGSPGPASGWSPTCHPAGGAGRCAQAAGTGCSMARLAIAGDASPDAGQASVRSAQALTPVVATAGLDLDGPRAAESPAPDGPRGPAPPPFLLHASLLL